MVLLAGLLGSCTASDNLPEASADAAVENGEFVTNPSMHYLVNGVVTNDKDLIKKSLSNAWNTHYDYSKNKVVISTNPTEFEKYKKNDIEFALRFKEGNESNDKGTNSARIAATYVPNYDDKLVFYCDVKALLYEEMYIFPITRVNDTDLYLANIFQLADLSTNYNIVSIIPVNMFGTVTKLSTTYKVYLKNNNHLSSKTLTIYRHKNLSTGAATRSFTVAKNQGIRMYDVDFRFSDDVFAKSYN